MLKGFKNFMMQGEVVVVAVGLVVATAFSNLVKAFTDNVINPLVAAAGGSGDSMGLGWLVNNDQPETFVDIGAFISGVIYFIIFMAVVYFVIVVPYRAYQTHRGNEVFGEPAPTKSCPECLSSDLPMKATKCKYCASPVSAA
ncbi:large conductance mechanosensitive channel protein MscL [Tomitella cavernea]|uniref:large conductance mechanosensitive channel protein MscL n=1 Tax=Tomitella cavernea TaxID=1387982 RepID=UPI0019057D3C|nr:MscL family protein [Tomitella cavernea]